MTYSATIVNPSPADALSVWTWCKDSLPTGSWERDSKLWKRINWDGKGGSPTQEMEYVIKFTFDHEDAYSLFVLAWSDLIG